jgi:hypothetical protein
MRSGGGMRRGDTAAKCESMLTILGSRISWTPFFFFFLPSLLLALGLAPPLAF